MSLMPLALTALAHRALILISGDEAEHFLEGLVTSALPQEGRAVGSALLTPQGKILFTFVLSRAENGYALECDASEMADLSKRLTLYKLRAKVTIAPSDANVYVTAEADAGQVSALIDGRHGDMGARVYGQFEAGGEINDYHRLRATLGVLEGPSEILASQDFPHDVGLDLTGAVSFTKGCFVGQEVVSRVKHRGTARRRPVVLAGDGLEAGAPVTAGEREIGTVRLVAGEHAIAVVRIDHLAAALGADGASHVSVGARKARFSMPPFATYDLATKA